MFSGVSRRRNTAGILAPAEIFLSRSLGTTGPWLGGFIMSALAPGGLVLAVLAEVQAEDGVIVGVFGAS
jgi:hypothetical protein